MRLSASQISTASGCLRKWAWDKIEKIPRKAHPAAELGSRVHKHMEAYYGGNPPPRGKEADIFYRALPHFSPPGEGVLSEEEVRPYIDGVEYLGYIDLYTPQVNLIQDLKTSGAPQRYGLTADTLRTDPQALIYAYAHMSNHAADQATCRWVYTSTKKPLAYPVEATLTRSEVEDGLSNHVIPIQDQLVQIGKSGAKALDVAPSWDHCYAYGGCPYKHLCKGTDDMKKNTDDLFADLLKDLPKAPATTAPVQATPPGMAVNPPSQAQIGVAKYAPAIHSVGEALIRLAAVLAQS